jgi:Uma2 family endonuclease
MTIAQDRRASRRPKAPTLPPPPDFDKPLPRGLRMTVEEFERWYTFVGKAEWVDGEVIVMSPVSHDHDKIQRWLASLLEQYVEHKNLGEILGPQFVMRLTVGRSRISRREPDVLFVSIQKLPNLTRNYLNGAPNLAIEVVSPESQSRDRRVKYLEYEAAGVGEYWIIDPLSENIEAYASRGGRFAPVPLTRGKFSSSVVKGWYLRPDWLWGRPRKSLLSALAELGIK